MGRLQIPSLADLVALKLLDFADREDLGDAHRQVEGRPNKDGGSDLMKGKGNEVGRQSQASGREKRKKN
jgi:hypothetical protein